MGYGCQKDFHIEDYAEAVRRNLPPSTKRVGLTLPPFTDEQRRELLTLGALGLAGEGGELIDLIKKHLFHGKPLDRAKMIEEAGDTLFYLQCLAEAIDSNLAEIAEHNRDKVARRYPNGFKPGGGVR